MTQQQDNIIFSYNDFEDVVRRFAQEVPHLLLRHPVTADLAFRISQLQKQMEWPVLRFAITIASANKIDDGNALCQALIEASGIEQLKNLLKDRFFSLAGLIKAGSVLRKAWDPCNIALLRIKN